jgi:hypothetical protein
MGELTLYRGLQMAGLRETGSPTNVGSLAQVEHVSGESESSAGTGIASPKIP